MPGEPPTALLTLTGVSFGYPQGPLVLRGIDLHIPRRTIAAVVGPNGAGKSTLARICAGVLLPQGGEVVVAGRSLAGLPSVERIRRVRVSFQYPERELFRTTLGAELDWEAERLDLPRATVRAHAQALFERCNMPNALTAHPYDLDPWARKLAATIAALAVPGRLVILDEPTVRLAQANKVRLSGVLTDYLDTGGSVLVVTHDYEFCRATCRTVARMAEGRIVRVGEPESTLVGPETRHDASIFSFPTHYLEIAAKQRSEAAGGR